VKARQGRLVEGEGDVRNALLNRLKACGKYNTQTAGIIPTWPACWSSKGRYCEAALKANRHVRHAS
jgi:hypothetical protein